MKVFALAVSQHGKPPKIYISQFDLSSFSFFQRGTVQEAMGFFIELVVERTPAGQRQTVQEQSYTGHTYVRQDGLAATIVCDKEYPVRVAFSVLGKLIDEFSSKFPVSRRGNQITWPELADHLVKCQDPQSAGIS